MSELLEQAIVDADALKEAALKNAEQAVIDKYSSEIKNTVEKLLEQQPGLPPDDMAALLGMGGGASPEMAIAGEAPGLVAGVPLAHGDGESICPCPDNEDTTITIDLEAIAEALEEEEEAGVGPTMGDITDRKEFAEEMLAEQEEIDLDEASLLSILEELAVDSRPNNADSPGGLRVDIRPNSNFG